MPEYLAPGVYVEEVSYRSKLIEGVPTSTTGYCGMTPFGPVQYTGGPSPTEPRLITSFTEFERVYGGIARIVPGGVERESYVGHAARAFFLNGGSRLYISRVFVPGLGSTGVAKLDRTAVATDPIVWHARWPGRYGNVVLVARPVRKGNSAYDHIEFGVVQVRGIRRGAVVEVTGPGIDPPTAVADVTTGVLRVVELDLTSTDSTGQPQQLFIDENGVATAIPAGSVVKEVVLQVRVLTGEDRVDVYDDLATHPAQRRWIGKILDEHDPTDEDAMVWLETAEPDDPERAIALLVALQTLPQGERLTGGDDGQLALPTDLFGDAADPDDATRKATGLEALGEVEDIAIVAVPDGGTYDDLTQCEQAAEMLIAHAEKLRYRIAVVDAPIGSSMNQVRAFRGKFDSTRGALYHPWIEIFDPNERPAQGSPQRRMLLPPSGFVTGIYARNDVTRGVFKAPANEVVRGLTKFEANINTPRNDVLNPEGINALRFFEGRGNRVWGARTMTSDPEWTYVNVRRLFIFLEHSIDKAMQWAVFEPNNPRLWNNIRQTVEDFLYVQWLNGALLGSKPEEAYFVRCDRTTMTQNDLDTGKLICLIGVAPTKPAEFVIFRIGQWTADAKV
jgi:phage tail sheath protein FI